MADKINNNQIDIIQQVPSTIVSFFKDSEDDVKVKEIKKLFSDFLSEKIPEGMELKRIPITQSLSNNMSLLNSVGGSVNFELGKDNYIYGLFPKTSGIAKNDNNNFKGKIYKAIVPVGKDNYMFADVKLYSNGEQISASDMSVTEDIFKAPTAFSVKSAKNKIVENVYTMTSDGIRKIANQNFGEITNRYLNHNYSVDKGSTFIDGSYITMSINATTQSSHGNQGVNLANSGNLQTFAGIEGGSSKTSRISDYALIKGKDLKTVLVNDPKAEKIYDNSVYKIDFDIATNEITSLKYVNKNFEESKYSMHESFRFNKNLTRERVMEVVGFENSKMRHLFTPDEVKTYNKILQDTTKNRAEVSKTLSERIILDHKVKALDNYGFDSIIERPKISNSNDIEAKKQYVKNFENYYNKLTDKTKVEEDFFDYFNNHLNVDLIANKIYKGESFDNFLDVAKQSANIAGKVRWISQAELNPFGYLNTDLQRKAQAGDKYEKFFLTMGDGNDLNVSKEMTKMFANSAKEFEYKKTKFNYAQGEQLNKYLGKKVGASRNIDFYQSRAKVLYTNTDLAFQDSDLFTNSFSMQNVSMFNNKKPMIIKYSSLSKNVFGDVTNDQIKIFLSSLEKNNYNFDTLEDSTGIKANFLKNLLGEENYSKYMEFKGFGNSTQISDELKNVGKSLEEFRKTYGQIEGNEKKYIEASSEVTGKFNQWLNKYFIKSDGESSINILNKDSVRRGVRTNISGSNYGFINDIKFTKDGIELNLKHMLVQSGGSKVMLDNVKATTQALTDLIALQTNGGEKIFVEGVINEKMTKGSRGFSGTFFSRSLNSIIYNSMYAEYGSDLTLEQKFNNAMEILKNHKAKIGPNGKEVNIFDLFNIDFVFDKDNETINFIDKNVGRAIDKIEDAKNGVSFNSLILDSMNENLRKYYGKNFTNDEAKVLGNFAADLMYDAYEDVLSQMTSESRARNQIRFENGKILKSYIAGDKIGMTEVQSLGTEKTKAYSYVLNADIYMMHESKKRAIEDGLKLGRLSGLTLSEISLNELVDVIEEKSSYEMNDVLESYMFLAARKDSSFARGTEAFNQYFDNVIDMTDKNIVYKPFNMNINIDQYLSKSLIGQLMDFDIEKERLNAPTKGILKGFETEYLKNLKEFFEGEHTFNDLGLGLANSIADATQNKTLIKIVKGKQNFDIVSGFLKNDEIINKFNKYKKENPKANDFGKLNFLYETYIESVFGEANKNLILNPVDSELKDKLFNVFKGYTSIAINLGEIRGEHFFEADSEMLSLIQDVNLDKGTLNKIVNYRLRDERFSKAVNVISSIFDNSSSFKNGNLSNLKDLSEIAIHGNIPFIIDNMSIDEVGGIVPNQILSSLEKIQKTNFEIADLYDVKRLIEAKKTGTHKIIKGKEILNAFEKFKQLNENNKQFDLEGLSGIISNLSKEVDLEVNFESISNKTFFNLFKGSEYGKNVTRKLSSNKIPNAETLLKKGILSKDNVLKIDEYMREEFADYIKKLSNSTSINGNFIDLFKNIGIEDSDLTGISSTALDILKKKKVYPGSKTYIQDYMSAISFLKKNYIVNEIDEEKYNSIVALEKNLIDFLGSKYKEVTVGGYYKYVNAFISKLENNEFKNETELKRMTGQIGVRRTSIFDIRKFFTDTKKIDEDILEKQNQLTSLLMNRNNTIGETGFKKGGKIFDSASTSIVNSAAVSPREGSAMTSFIKNEIIDVLKTKDKDSLNELKDSLRLIYGKYYTEDIFKKIDKNFKISNLDDNKMRSTAEEIVEKLDNLSHIVIGDEEMYKRTGQFNIFKRKGGKIVNSTYGMLSRHPHQYKLSLSPTRFVLIPEEYKSKSFIGKYLGTGNTVDGSQSSLIMIGKKTALSAKGDFDGDVFQIMFLGDKDLDYMKYSNMDSKAFLNKYRKKLELLNMLNNSTSDDLESIFMADKSNTSIKRGFKKSKYNKMKELITEVYDFKNKKYVSNEEAYNAVKSTYLSLVHENARVLATLVEEKEEHAQMPKVLGSFIQTDINSKKINEISKMAISELVLTLPDEYRNKLLTGRLDGSSLNETFFNTILSDNSNILSKKSKDALAKAYGKSGGINFIIESIQKIMDDNDSIAWQQLYRAANKFKDDVGLYKTPMVHTEITNFRNTMNALMNKETFAKAVDYLQQKTGNKNAKLFLDRDVLFKATSAHDLGTLIEKLAISSKKGSTSPDEKISQFLIGEKVMMEKDIDFNFENIAKKVVELESDIASDKLQNNLMKKTEFLNQNFDEWFRSLYKDNLGNDILDDDYAKLKKAFLIFGNVENIDKKMSDSTLSIMDIFKTTKNLDNLKNVQFSTLLSTWTSVMFKGQFERTMYVNEDINTQLYKQIFPNRPVNFYDQMEVIARVSKEYKNNEKFGTRNEAKITMNTASNILEQQEQKNKVLTSVNNTNNILIPSENTSKTVIEKLTNKQTELTNEIAEEQKFIIDKIDNTSETLQKAKSSLTNIVESKKDIEKRYKFISPNSDVIDDKFLSETSSDISKIDGPTDQQLYEYYDKMARESKIDDDNISEEIINKSSKEQKTKVKEINNLKNKATKTLEENTPSPFVRTNIHQDQSVRAILPEPLKQIEKEYPFLTFEVNQSYYNQEIQNRIYHNKNDFSKKQLKRELQADLNIPEDAKIGKVNGFIPKERVDIITGTDYDGNAASGRKKWTKGIPQADIEWEYDGYKYYSQVQIVDGKWRGDIYKVKIDSNVDTVNNAVKEAEANLSNLSKIKKDLNDKNKITPGGNNLDVSSYSPIQDSEYGFDITSNMTAKNTARRFAGDALTTTADAIDNEKNVVSRGINKTKVDSDSEEPKIKDIDENITEEEKVAKEAKKQETKVKSSKEKIEEKNKIKSSNKRTKKQSKANKPVEQETSDTPKSNVVDNQTKELKEKINSYKSELENNKKIIEQQKEEIISSRNEIDNVKKQYSKAIDVINEKSDSKINKLEVINKTSSERINILEKDISSKNETIGTLTDDVKSKDVRINNLLEQIEKEKKLHSEQISELEIKHAEEIKNKDKLISDNEKKAKKILEKAQQDYYELGSKEAKEKYAAKIDKLNKSYDDKVENVLKNHFDELNKKQNEISELTNQLNEQKTNYTKLVNQNKIDLENASIEINKLKEEYSTHISGLIEQNKADNKTLVKEMKNQFKEQSKAEIKTKTDKLKEEHKLKIEKLKEQNKADKKESIDKLKQKQETKIKELKEEFKKDKKASIERLKENQEAKIKELKEQYKIDSKIKTDDLKEKHKAEIKELERSKKEAIKKLNDEKNQKIKKIKKDLEEEKTKLINALNDKKEVEQTLANEQSNTNKIQSQLDAEKKAAKELQNRYEQEKSQLIKEHESKINHIEESKQIEIEKISKEKDRKIADVQNELKKTKKEKEEIIRKAREYKNKKDQIISDMEENARKAKRSIDESEEQLRNIKKHVKGVNDKLDNAKETIKNNSDKYKEEIKKIKQEASENLSKIKYQYENKINDLNAKIVKLSKENEENIRHSTMNKIAKKTIDSAKTFTSHAAETVSNNKVVKATTDFAGQHKKALALAAGSAVLAGFFRIFQSNRPVVNLDINEQEYERSQGSVYRNLGQYTMNTNIRSLY